MNSVIAYDIRTFRNGQNSGIQKEFESYTLQSLDRNLVRCTKG
jgi:hypothetical protein